MNQFEVTAYLADALPEIKADIKTISPRLNIFKSIQCFSDYTKHKLKQHNLRAIKKCFTIADNIYARGNGLVKDAMENIFVFSFSSMLNMSSKEERIKLQSLMPLSLYSAYVQQMLKSGI